jgi:hypothetical protein
VLAAALVVAAPAVLSGTARAVLPGTALVVSPAPALAALPVAAGASTGRAEALRQARHFASDRTKVRTRSARARARLVMEIVATLDALLAHERAGGGWTFASAPGARPQPCTVPLKIAERLAAPFGLARWDLVVLRSPGTPAAGLALLGGYRLTGRPDYLEAARRAGDLLIAIQMRSGGWFSEMPVEGTALSPWFAATVRRTMLDDDVTTGATRLLLALWEATGERRYRYAAERALALLVRAQLPVGAWPPVWRPAWKRVLWPTFEDLATLNDGTTAHAIATLAAAGRTLGRADLLAVARRGGDWLARARRPAPQAGWAQQYDGNGQPAPARRFEPAALASWESRHAIEALLALAAVTGEARYCAPIPDALRWLERAAIGPGCWARFYALGSNAPLYVDGDGQRVDSPAKAHPGYDWTGDFGIPALFARLGWEDAEKERAVGSDTATHGSGTAPLEPTTAVRAARQPDELLLARPVAGDPGVCPAEHPQGFHRHAPDDPRALAACATMLLAALEPEEESPCVRALSLDEVKSAR